jgi:hypothetical protein
MSGAAKRADQGGRRGAWGVVRAVAVRYPVGSFVVLAFVVSWAAWGPLLADRQGWVTWSASTYLHLLGALGPLVAAVVVTGLGRGWDGLGVLWSQATAWRGRGRWLALATLGPLTLWPIGWPTSCSTGSARRSAGEATSNRPWNSDARCYDRPPSSVWSGRCGTCRCSGSPPATGSCRPSGSSASTSASWSQPWQVDRGGAVRGSPADRRDRKSSQGSQPPGRGAHRAVRAALREPDRLLVCNAWPAHRRPRRPPRPGTAASTAPSPYSLRTPPITRSQTAAVGLRRR